MTMQNDDILTSIATEVTRLEAEIRTKEAELAGLKHAEETIRLARGTGQVMPEPSLPPRVERRTRTRAAAVLPVAGITPPALPPPAGIAAQIREILSQQSLPVVQLAHVIGTTLELMQSTLDTLERSGQVHRFSDGAYTWKVGGASSETLTTVIKRYMLERQVTRRDLMRAIGVEDKLLEKRVDNQLDYVRETELVWAQKDAEGHLLYWIVAGQKPPRELDGRKQKRNRSRPSANSPHKKATSVRQRSRG